MDNVTKSFAGIRAVRDLTLDVRRGSIHALIGPNGAGKTTLFNLATKFLRPSGGRIVFKGRTSPMRPRAPWRGSAWSARSRSRRYFRAMTARENVRVALQTPAMTALHSGVAGQR